MSSLTTCVGNGDCKFHKDESGMEVASYANCIRIFHLCVGVLPSPPHGGTVYPHSGCGV